MEVPNCQFVALNLGMQQILLNWMHRFPCWRNWTTSWTDGSLRSKGLHFSISLRPPSERKLSTAYQNTSANAEGMQIKYLPAFVSPENLNEPHFLGRWYIWKVSLILSISSKHGSINDTSEALCETETSIFGQ